jgi:hypothetical protein
MLDLSDEVFCHTPQGYLTFRKILRRRADGFTSPPKKVVVRIFIALENHSPQPSLNPQTLGPMASTITTRASRMT